MIPNINHYKRQHEFLKRVYQNSDKEIFEMWPRRSGKTSTLVEVANYLSSTPNTNIVFVGWKYEHLNSIRNKFTCCDDTLNNKYLIKRSNGSKIIFTIPREFVNRTRGETVDYVIEDEYNYLRDRDKIDLGVLSTSTKRIGLSSA